MVWIFLSGTRRTNNALVHAFHTRSTPNYFWTKRDVPTGNGVKTDTFGRPTALQLARNAKSFSTTTTTVARPKGDTFWQANMGNHIWRPTVNDVERISWGKPAKKKGTGSRGVPHRLNQDERQAFDRARQHGFLQVPGSAWRAQRREAPLLNTYRSLCDARAQVSLVLHKSCTGVDDALVLDLSPLRNPVDFEKIAHTCLTYHNGGQVVTQSEGNGLLSNTASEEEPMSSANDQGKNDNDEHDQQLANDENPWETRPIYQLPPFCIVWELSRPDAKTLGKKLAELFDTAEGKRASSKMPIGVKPGKNRRHGGYGIG